MKKNMLQNEKTNVKNNIKNKFKTLILFLIITTGVLFILQSIFPERSQIGHRAMLDYGLEVIYIFPAVLVLMGLAEVWIPADRVKDYLGKESGFKGVLLSLFLGTLPTGPLFIAFPIAGEMISKKASIANVVVFLGAWASLKIPQIGVEIQFLGIKFTFYRVILTFVSVLCIAFWTQKMVERKDNKILI